MSWFTVVKKDKKDMRVGTVYPSDREGKKIMILTHEGKKIHAGAKGYGNYKRKGKNRGGGTHKDPARRKNFRARHNCDQCKGRITTPKCLACKKTVVREMNWWNVIKQIDMPMPDDGGDMMDTEEGKNQTC